MEDYGKLEKIVDETIKLTIADKSLDLISFFQNMEMGFKILGFREEGGGGSIQKILLLRLDAVGDFILLTPSIRAIRENFPRAYITLVVTKEVYPFAELCPYVNEVIVFETPFKSSFDNGDIINILTSTTEFSKQYLWKQHFDICFAFLNDFTHCFMAYISGAKIRIAHAGRIYDVLMTHPFSKKDKNVFHYCEDNLFLPKSFGVKINSKDLELWYDAEDIRRAKNILGNFAQDRIKIAAGIGANHAARKYPVEKYLTAFKEIISKGASIIILGGSSEVDDAKFLEDNLPKGTVKNIAAIRPGWRVDAAIVSFCDMYIGNDTGTKHVAAALKKPVIVLTRETKDRSRAAGSLCEHILFAPWQTKYIILQPEHSLGDCVKTLKYSCRAGKPHCITQIEPSEIIDAYEKILKHCK